MNERAQRLVQFVKDRLAEASTYQGLAFLLSFFGVNGLNYKDPEQLAAATALGAILSALIKVFVPDKK